MAGVGRIFKRKMKLADSRVVEDHIWHVAFYHRGKEYRITSGTDNEVKARKFLKKKLGELSRGRYVANEERVTFEDLCKLIRDDYAVNGYRSTDTLNFTISHLEGFFKFDRAVDILPDRVLDYQQKRLSEGAARRTVNLEVANPRSDADLSCGSWENILAAEVQAFGRRERERGLFAAWGFSRAG